jgi:hypothetical protein
MGAAAAARIMVHFILLGWFGVGVVDSLVVCRCWLLIDVLLCSLRRRKPLPMPLNLDFSTTTSDQKLPTTVPSSIGTAVYTVYTRVLPVCSNVTRSTVPMYYWYY